MSPVTHFLISWGVANALPNASRRERVLITLGGIIPDVDGVGAVPDKLTLWFTDSPTRYFHEYHHDLHCVGWAAFCVLGAFALAGKGADLARRLTVASLVALTFHLHLFCDVIGARGPDGNQWPIPYLLPFSDAWS